VPDEKRAWTLLAGRTPAFLCRNCAKEAYWLLITRAFFKTFSQYRLCAGMAFSAAGADAELIAQAGHGCHSRINGLADFSLGDIMANADNH
jgi:hypothetical protein